jgi:hypothetical protein
VPTGSKQPDATEQRRCKQQPNGWRFIYQGISPGLLSIDQIDRA